MSMSSYKISDVWSKGYSPIVSIYADEGFEGFTTFPTNGEATYSGYGDMPLDSEGLMYKGEYSYVGNFAKSDDWGYHVFESLAKSDYVFLDLKDSDGNEVYYRFDNGNIKVNGKAYHDVRTGIFPDLRSGNTYYLNSLPRGKDYSGTYDLGWGILKANKCDSYELLNHASCNYFTFDWESVDYNMFGLYVGYGFQYLSVTLGYLINVVSNVKVDEYDSTKDGDDGFFANGKIRIAPNLAFRRYTKIASATITFNDNSTQTFSDTYGKGIVEFDFDNALLIKDISITLNTSTPLTYSSSFTIRMYNNASSNQLLIAKADDEELSRHPHWAYFVTDNEGNTPIYGGNLAYKYGYISDEIGYMLIFYNDANLNGSFSFSTLSYGTQMSNLHIVVSEKLRDIVKIAGYTVSYYTYQSSKYTNSTYTKTYSDGTHKADFSTTYVSYSGTFYFYSITLNLEYDLSRLGNLDSPLGLNLLKTMFETRAITTENNTYPYGYGVIDSGKPLCVIGQVKSLEATSTSNVYNVVLGYDEGYYLPKCKAVMEGYSSSKTQATSEPSVTTQQSIECDETIYPNDWVIFTSNIAFKRVGYNSIFKDFMYTYDTSNSSISMPKVSKVIRGKSYIGIMNSQHIHDTWSGSTYTDKSLCLLSENAKEVYFSVKQVKQAYGYDDDVGLDIWIDGSAYEPITEEDGEELESMSYPWADSFWAFPMKNGNVNGVFVVYNTLDYYYASKIEALLSDGAFDIYTLSSTPTFASEEVGENGIRYYFSFDEDTTLTIAVNDTYKGTYVFDEVRIWCEDLDGLKNANGGYEEKDNGIVFRPNATSIAIAIPSNVKITMLAFKLKKNIL